MAKQYTMQTREIKKITGFGKPFQIKRVPAIYENGEFYIDIPLDWSVGAAAMYIDWLNGDASTHDLVSAGLVLN